MLEEDCRVECWSEPTIRWRKCPLNRRLIAGRRMPREWHLSSSQHSSIMNEFITSKLTVISTIKRHHFANWWRTVNNSAIFRIFVHVIDGGGENTQNGEADEKWHDSHGERESQYTASPKMNEYSSLNSLLNWIVTKDYFLAMLCKPKLPLQPRWCLPRIRFRWLRTHSSD